MLNVTLFSSYTRPSMDLAEPWQIGFQDPATPVLEGIIDFHNDVNVLLNCNWYCSFYVLGRVMMVLFEDNNTVPQ